MSDYEDDSGERTVSELEELHGTLKEIHATLKSRFDLSGISWFIVIMIFLGDWQGSNLDRFTDRLWYSVSTGTEWKNININKRPSDCDFIHAPLGAKGCKYEKQSSVFGEKERQEWIRQATTPEGKQTYAKMPDSVYVYWEKKQIP